MTTTIQLPQLPYEMDALEPYISKETMEYHYGKHHQAYVNNVNNLIADSDFKEMSLEDIILKSDGGLFNNAAQVYNHTFYFLALTPNLNSKPSDELTSAIVDAFGSVDSMKEEFNKVAMGQFGSGWTWLVADNNNKLSIVKTSNALTPIIGELKPILCVDVWEHAYYIDYRNKRAEYLEKIWNIVDWDKVSQRWENI